MVCGIRYIRCIKPNSDKRADTYNEQLVLDQLRYLGMLDIIRIRREGYPVHLDFETFFKAFACLCPPFIRRQSASKDSASAVLKHLKQPTHQWQVDRCSSFRSVCDCIQKIFFQIRRRKQKKTKQSND